MRNRGAAKKRIARPRNAAARGRRRLGGFRCRRAGSGRRPSSGRTRSRSGGGCAGPAGRFAAVRAPAAAIRDPAQLLGVDVHQLARPVTFVAADHPPGRTIHPCQPAEAVPDEHPMHGGGRHAELVADPDGPTLRSRRNATIRCSSAADSGEATMRPAGAIDQPASPSSGSGGATCTPSAARCPSRARHARRATRQDPIDQNLPPQRVNGALRCIREGLLLAWTLSTHTMTGQPLPVNNLSGPYS